MERVNACFDDLDHLNGYLRKFNLQPAASKTAAAKALRAINVNIFDLVSDETPKVFKSVRELGAYTIKNKKVFPRKKAKSEGLRVFLRHIAFQ